MYGVMKLRTVHRPLLVLQPVDQVGGMLFFLPDICHPVDMFTTVTSLLHPSSGLGCLLLYSNLLTILARFAKMLDNWVQSIEIDAKAHAPRFAHALVDSLSRHIQTFADGLWWS